MKKKSALLLTCFIAILSTKAQYVNIPDTAFRNSIRTKWPGCFNALGQMDTTCNPIVNYGNLSVDGENITNLTGIKYFKSIKYLTCTANKLDSFPELPPLLTDIYANNNLFKIIPKLPPQVTSIVLIDNQITVAKNISESLQNLYLNNNPLVQIDSLPNSLVNLYCSFTLLKTLPILPTSLQSLYCANSPITSLPTLPTFLQDLTCNNDSLSLLPLLPPNLRTLDCSFNQIDSLSAFPSTLYILNCNYNNISKLSALPDIMTTLNCTGNKISSLPTLPSALVTLACDNNLITQLPALPSSLNSLGCGSNLLTQLPSLPNNLSFLGCDYNKITALPYIPSNISYLSASSNLLTALPNLPPTMTTLDVQNNKITTLPALPDSLKRFYINSNPLTSIVSIPTTLTELGISYTKISSLPTLPNSLSTLSVVADSNLHCIPYLPKDLTYIATVYSGVTCLPNIPSNCTNANNLPICSTTNNSNECQSYPQIYGLVFNDNNNNGIKDIGDVGRANIKVLLSNGAFAYTNTNGVFNISSDTIGSYDVTIIKPNFYNSTPTSFVHNLSTYTAVVNDTFALKAYTVKDTLSVHITPMFSRARPGFQFPYHVQFENVGTTVLSPTIKVKFDATKLRFDSSSIPSVVSAGDSLLLYKSNFLQGDLSFFNIYFTIKTTTAIGDSIITTASGKAASAYSIDYASNIVRGSYDPNDKVATPSLTPSQVSNGSFVDYTIRFQNTGNDTAFTVVVADTLSSLLQTNVLQMLGTSHLCKTTLYNGIVYFEFKNINLPDSGANKLLSNGFIRFRIRPDSSVILGDVIPNNASIYFDYNAPIVTNTCQTIIKNKLLPLQLLSYKASLTKNRQVLNEWTTTNEVNTAFFNIERSGNGKDFKTVGKVKALSNRGTISYQFTDPLLDESLLGNVYYRLAMWDKDGTKTYSPLQRVVLSNNLFVNIYPNPAQNVVTIEGKELSAISIVDNTGRMMWTKKLFNSSKEILSVKQFSKGVYFVKVIHENGEMKTEKLVIE